MLFTTALLKSKEKKQWCLWALRLLLNYCCQRWCLFEVIIILLLVSINSRGFSKIDHSGRAVRIVLEQNKQPFLKLPQSVKMRYHWVNVTFVLVQLWKQFSLWDHLAVWLCMEKLKNLVTLRNFSIIIKPWPLNKTLQQLHNGTLKVLLRTHHLCQVSLSLVLSHCIYQSEILKYCEVSSKG